jgi:superfamily II DNA/RNA helicase
LFFSATMPPEIKRLADNFLSNPVRVEASPPATAAVTVSQYLAPSGREPVDKRAVLRALIRGADNFKNAIIFCNRKRDVAVLHRSLAKHGFNVGALHGDMDQRARMATLDDFRKDRIKLLVASDVAARGLDIPAVSHIFNFDVPTHSEDYVHRIGRTGRAGLTGTAITIATPIDRKYVSGIERLLGHSIPPLEVPAAADERAKAFNKSRAEREESRASGEPEERAQEPHHRAPRHDRSRDRGGHRQVNGSSAESSPARREPAAAASRDAKDNRPHHEPRVSPARSHANGPPKVRNEERRDRPQSHQAQPERARDQQRPRHEERRREQPKREDRAPVIGMGDHMPDFLRRPVKVPTED